VLRPGIIALAGIAILAGALAIVRGDARAPARFHRLDPPSEESRVAALATGRAAKLRGKDAARARRMGVRDVRAPVTSSVVDGDRVRIRVAVTYAIRGVGGRFASDRDYLALKQDGRWRLRRAIADRQRPPWEVASFRRVRSRHFVVLAPRSIDPGRGHLLTALEDGYSRIRSLLRRGELRRRYLVVVAATAVQARALTSEIRGLASLAALTDTEVKEAGPERRVTDVASQRLLVIWPAFRDAGDQAATVVAHELTHAVLAPVTSGRTPAWLTEGVALYVSGDRRVSEAADRVAGESGSRRVLSLSGLDRPDAVARLMGDRQAAAYAYSSAAAFYIASRFGHGRLLRLYDVFNEGDVDDTDAAVRRVLGVSLPRLERDLRRWVIARAVVGSFQRPPF
jgi:hypothetical protein